MKPLWRRLRFLPKDKQALLSKLLDEAERGDCKALALAYLVNELCPDDRTTRDVFRSLRPVVQQEAQ